MGLTSMTVVKRVSKQNSQTNTADDSHMRLCNRPLLQRYLGLGFYLDFHAIFAYKSMTRNGIQVACMKSLRDPIDHSILADHIWVRLSDKVASTLDHVGKGAPVRIRGKVVLYDKGEKVGLKIAYVNLVRGQRTYTIGSKRTHDK